MRFMLMDRVTAQSDELGFPDEQQMSEMQRFMEESGDVLQSTEGLHPTATGVRVRLAEDRATLTEGPFTDSISNFAIIEADSQEQAIEHAKRWLKIWGKGETEIRRVVEEEDLPQQ